MRQIVPLPRDPSIATAFCVFVSVFLPQRLGSVQSSEGPEQPRVTCSSDSPVIDDGTSVALRAWALSRGSSPPSYLWTVDTGKITGDGWEVQWDFSDVPSSPQPHYAEVTVAFPSGDSANCQVRVTASGGQRSPRVNARSFLVKGKPQSEGYGLYSYLLLGSRPSGASRQRCLAAIRAYLAGMEDVDRQNDLPKPILNITYLPIEKTQPPDFTPEWLLDNYDYARAQALLHALPGDLTDGPYFVSTLRPIDFNSHPSQYLFQNLSLVPTEPEKLISWWVREFLHQSAQERFWEPQTAEVLALKLRTTVAVVALGLPDVQRAIASWISWKH